jgi:hypothetical protein
VATHRWLLSEGEENGDRLLRRVAGTTSEAYLEGEAYPGHTATDSMCRCRSCASLGPRHRARRHPSTAPPTPPTAAAPLHTEPPLHVARTRQNPSSRRRRLACRPACWHQWEERERTSGEVVVEERKKEEEETIKEKEIKRGKEKINELFIFINCNL